METLHSTIGNFTLTKLDNRIVGNDKDEIRVVLIAHNEITRLPFLLDYYRRLGVARFLVVDDKSNDGTREYLLAQPDCHVFAPSNTYRELQTGRHWRAVLLDTYGDGYWTLVLDADELLVYPHCEQVDLKELCRYLDSIKARVFFAFMLDLYARDPNKAVCEPGKPFYEICPYFDRDYRFRTIGPRNPEYNHLPRLRINGGPRVRLFYPFQKYNDFFSRALLKCIITAADKMTFWRGDKPHYAPALIKVPLIKWQTGYDRLTSHTVSGPRQDEMAQARGALLHFKFFTDFHEKSKKHVANGQYLHGSQEYQRYIMHMARNPERSFMYEGSVRYEGSDSVLKAGLIESTPAYDAYAQNLKNPQKSAA